MLQPLIRSWLRQQRGRRTSWRRVLASAAIVAIGIAFVLEYVFRYYLNYTETACTDPFRGEANYWAQRGWLLMHIKGGMTALLTGPWQFWTGFRTRYARQHRRPQIC